MKHRLLIVDDCGDQQVLINHCLSDNFELVFATTGTECINLVNRDYFDLILLDVELPDIDGHQLCSLFKTDHKLKHTPVMFLTSKDSVQDKILGLSLGADGYITKPFNYLELKTKVSAKLRSSFAKMAASNVISLGHLILYKDQQKAYDISNGQKQEIVLTSLEFKILLHFMNNVDQPITREQIVKDLWPESTHVSYRTVDSHISRVRKKLAECSDYLESVYGVGYRFVPSAKK